MKLHLIHIIGKILPQFFTLFISSQIVLKAGEETYAQYILIITGFTLINGVISNALDLNFEQNSNVNDYKDIIILKVLLFLPAIIIIISKWNIPNIKDSIIIIFIGIFYLAGQFVETYIRKERIIRRDKYSAYIRSITPGIILVIILSSSRLNLLSISLFSGLSSFIILYCILSEVNLSPINWTKLFTIFKLSLPLIVSLFASQAYGSIDLFFLNSFIGSEAVSIFKIGHSFANIFMPFAVISSFIFMSEFVVNLKHGKYSDVLKDIRSQLLILFSIAITNILFNVFALPYLFPYLYGDSLWTKVNEIILPLSLTGSINIISLTFAYTLLAARRNRELAIIPILTSSLYIVLAKPLINNFGLNGLCYCSIFCYSCSLIAFLYQTRIILKNKKLAETY